MASAIEVIKELREQTGAPMMDVKKALDEAKGDKARAIEIIRIKGLAKAAKRVDRETGEGLVAAQIIECKDGKCAGKKCGYIIQLNSETDFVAKSEKFVNLANDILKAIVDAKAVTVEDALKAKTAEGTVEDAMAAASGVLGEKIELKNVGKVTGDSIGVYLHKKDKSLPPSSGSIVAFNGKVDDEKATQIAVSITGYRPDYERIEDIPQDVIDSEIRVAKEKNAGKPENIVMEKIVPGVLAGFYKEHVLLEGTLSFDESVTIKSLIGDGEYVGYLSFKVGA
jgi:elongation factor Ts